jgi:hypothetical protein
MDLIVGNLPSLWKPDGFQHWRDDHLKGKNHTSPACCNRNPTLIVIKQFHAIFSAASLTVQE